MPARTSAAAEQIQSLVVGEGKLVEGKHYGEPQAHRPWGLQVLLPLTCLERPARHRVTAQGDGS
jgi:hypothetical protein